MSRVLHAYSLALLTVSALAGCGGGGGSSPPPPPAPTVTLTNSSADVAVNGSVTLTWSSMNATGCTASGAWSGALATAGSQSVVVTQTSTYSLACTGNGGTANGSTSVTAWSAPTATISADKTAILSNGTVRLSWSSQNAKTCTGTGGLSGTIANSGSQASGALTATTTFSISCSNPVFAAAATASVIVTVTQAFTLAVTVQYQAPGAPVVNAARTFLVPDWARPVLRPVPFVSVELDNPAGAAVQSTSADANGIAQFSGLDPAVTYTPVILSRITIPSLGVDFEVVNNTAPVNINQGSFRARYPPYAGAAAAYTPDRTLVNQALTITAPDGWNAATSKLVDANRVAGPFALLAAAAVEAQTISAATGLASVTWRPLTILWSVKNKGGLTAPPVNFDQGIVTGSGGFWSSGHQAIDATGAPTGASIAEDHIFLSGDPTFELMEIYPFVMTHEMGHFTQAQFSTIDSSGGDHGSQDYEDPLLAWIEGSASGIAALVMNTPEQRRVGTVSGEIVVGAVDISTAPHTINGTVVTQPVGWFQEDSVAGVLWQLYNPQGATRLSPAAVLAPMFSSAWQQGPWLNTAWAEIALLKQGNPAIASTIDSLVAPFGISAFGNDVWGVSEFHTGNRNPQDVLPPYTTIVIGGQAFQVCSVGAPNEYNKAGNRRLLRMFGDGARHTLTVQGPPGTVPTLNGFLFNPGSATVSASGVIPVQGSVLEVGDCAVVLSPFASDTAACLEPSPPPEECWSVTLR